MQSLKNAYLAEMNTTAPRSTSRESDLHCIRKLKIEIGNHPDNGYHSNLGNYYLLIFIVNGTFFARNFLGPVLQSC
jgi:hypothetical protein